MRPRCKAHALFELAFIIAIMVSGGNCVIRILIFTLCYCGFETSNSLCCFFCGNDPAIDFFAQQSQDALCMRFVHDDVRCRLGFESD